MLQQVVVAGLPGRGLVQAAEGPAARKYLPTRLDPHPLRGLLEAGDFPVVQADVGLLCHPAVHEVIEIQAADHLVGIGRDLEPLREAFPIKPDAVPPAEDHRLEGALPHLPEAPGAVVEGFGGPLEQQDAPVVQSRLHQMVGQAQARRPGPHNDVVVVVSRAHLVTGYAAAPNPG